MKRLFRMMASARLAAWLIAGQAAFLLVSFLVPQRGIFPDEQVDAFIAAMPGPIAWVLTALEFDHAFTSALFYATAVLLALNLIACTWQRVARRFGRGLPSGAGVIPGSALVLAIPDWAAVEETLRALGAHVTEQGPDESRYYLRRGDLGFIGSVIMHAALVMVLLGGVLTGLTTFRGEMLFTEGQAHSDTPDDYLTVAQVPSLGDAFRDFEITLDRMEFTYEGGTVVDAVANLRVIDGGGVRDERASVNYPLKVKGKSFLLQDAGHSVWVTVTDASGAVLIDSFVSLLNVTDRGYEDSIALPAGQLVMLSRPDDAEPRDASMGNGLQLVSPVVGLAIDDVGPGRDYAWVLPGSDSVTVGPYTVKVNEVRIWNRFMVRADGGRHVMYVSFFLIIVGSVLRFVDPDRWLKAAIVENPDGVTLSLWGAERYHVHALPREGAQLARRVAQRDDSGSTETTAGDPGDTTSREAFHGS